MFIYNPYTICLNTIHIYICWKLFYITMSHIRDTLLSQSRKKLKVVKWCCIKIKQLTNGAPAAAIVNLK